MCGIAAQAGVRGSDGARLRALEALVHRGPDGGDDWRSEDGRVWLGHRRLAIVDLSPAGSQPMRSENGAVQMVCNGEIYNYPILRAQLEKLGHRFTSASDSEVVVHAYEQWGAACVDHLEGMFAFVLWDASRRRLLAARDRVGVKPLYYAPRGDSVVLASEIGALFPLLPEPAEPDPMATAYVMTLGYVPAPHSMWRGIHKLEAGHLLHWEPGSEVRLQRYWEPPKELDPDAGDESGEEWENLCHDVLREHLQSDVPIGLFLSGGLDSTAIAAGLREIGRGGTALTVGFPENPKDETAVAVETAQLLGLQHRTISLKIPEVGVLASQVAEAFDEPQSYSALLSMHRLCAAAAKDWKVVLSGDGGDEVFGGYSWYDDLDEGGAPARSGSTLRRALGARGGPRVRRLAARTFASQSPLHRHAWRLHPRFLPEEAESLLSPGGLRFGDEQMLEPLRRHFCESLPLKRALQRVDLMTFCSDSILAKVDRASMAHSLEVRVPWLDRRVIEWGLVRPVSAAEIVASKPVLREYLRERAPKSVLDRPKQGFSLPILDGFDFDVAIDEIRAGPWVREGHWSERWERFLRPGVPYRGARVWNLWSLTQWATAWFPRSRVCDR